MSSETKIDGVDLIERKTVFQGYFRVDRYALRHKRFDGSWSAPIVREIFERGHAAAVLLYDPMRDEVALIEQFRPGAYAAGWYPWQIEIVAGIVDADETDESTAIREAKEEAGVEVTDLVEIANLIATSGGSSETVHMFCARIDATTLGGFFGVVEENEDIRLFVVPADEAIGWIATGKVNNAIGVVALQWLALNRGMLKKRWSA
jgi:ADP-ribose pyrophosphatase